MCGAQCACSPSRGRCRPLPCISKGGDFHSDAISALFFVHAYKMYNALQSDWGVLYRAVESPNLLRSIPAGYRYSSSFTYRISWAELGTWLTPPTTRRRSLMTMEDVEHRGKFMGANLSHFFL